MLAVEPAPVPVPAAGEVLVEVHAAAITFDELTWDETWTRGGVTGLRSFPRTKYPASSRTPRPVSPASRRATRSMG